MRIVLMTMAMLALLLFGTPAAHPALLDTVVGK